MVVLGFNSVAVATWVYMVVIWGVQTEGKWKNLGWRNLFFELLVLNLACKNTQSKYLDRRRFGEI